MTTKNKECSEINSDVDFDWDLFTNDSNVPKYQDILDEIEKPTGTINSDVLVQYHDYNGLTNITHIDKGSTVNGRVIRISDKDIILDIDNKDNVIIERKGSEERICKQLQLGQEIDVLINQVSEHPYMIKGSISDLIRQKVDTKMKEFFTEQIPFNAQVREIIPAGYMLDIDIDNIIINAFMPNTLADVNKLHDPEMLLNKNITVMLETLHQDKGIYVVSRKRYLKTLIPEKIKKLEQREKTQLFVGHVTGTRDFGVFVQFDECLTGMIHKVNINEDFKDKILDIKPGTEIEFYVKDVIKGGSQIILTQSLEDSLWDVVRVGDKIEGSVIAVKPFGALIMLDYETNGLIQTTYINKNNKSLKRGEKVEVVVISIIRDDRKIYLTFADDNATVDKLKDKFTDLEKLKSKFNS